MTSAADWLERGRELGATLNACHAVVVVGADPIATAEVALGIAQRQSEQRRVAVGDLIGDVAPLQNLIDVENAHGIVDSFVFGVSLNKVAYPVTGNANLFIMPTGSSPIDHDELLPNPRWRRLSGGFREVGALLVLAIPFDAGHLRDLVDTTDGVIIVGDSAPADIPVAQALAWLRPRRAPAAAPLEAPLAVVTATPKPAVDRSRTLAAAAGIAVSLLFIAAMLWFAARPFVGKPPKHAVSETKPTAPAAAAVLHDSGPRTTADSVQPVDSSGGSLPDSFPVLGVTNPMDSVRASSWSVRLERTNTPAAAILDLRGRFETVPAGTYGYEDLRTRFLLLVGGAFPNRAGADSLLLQLHQNRTLPAGSGSVVALPFAFLVQQDVPAADVPKRLNSLAASGKPVYALRQPNQTVNLYFGAYETPQHAALAVPAVRDAGLTPTLVYRTGRVF